MSTTPEKWTPAQRDAITHDGGGLLVSAAAGSGKTSVLAARCAHLVCDAAHVCSVHELLVVTFTEAAAGEMKNRIGRAIADRHDVNPTDHTARQLAMLDRAAISTLHGFCARLLRQHFHLLGLDPNFRILDGDEAGLLKREVAREAFARRYDADGPDGDRFRKWVDLYGDGDDERLVELTIAVHESLGSVVDPGRWAADTRARLADAAAQPLATSDLGKRYLDDLVRDLNGLLRECAAAGKFVVDLGGFAAYAEHLRQVYSFVKHWLGVLNTHGLDALAEEVRELPFPRLKPVAATVPDRDLAKGRVDGVNDEVKKGDWRRRLAFTEPQWRDGMAATLPHAEELLSLVDAYGLAYRVAKDQAGGLDFNDLERLTLDVLSDGPDRPSAVARAYHAQFRHVMVDEYQDINEVQDAILARLSRDCSGRPGTSNLFCVGDVKQAIYRFRLADPARFLRRRRHYAEHADHGRVIDLQQNFRSRGPLLDAVNAVFRRLMTKAAADLDYDDSQQLVFGATHYADDATGFAGSPIELHLLPKDVATDGGGDADDGEDAADLDRAQREAVLVGHRVLEITGRRGKPAATVTDRDGTVRPARFADCVVLLRTMRGKAETFAKQLRAMGVPVHSESRTGYFEATEVNDVLSLLRVLDNGLQDVPLAAVLRSPLANLPDPEDALARVRAAFPTSRDDEVPFHQAVRSYAATGGDELAAKLADVLAELGRWRRVARDRPVAELLWAVYDETGYLAFCGGLPRGEQRQANLVELHERARQFGTFRRQGLGRFLAFLEKLRDESDLGQAAVATEAEDVVRLMSVHRAKGLEFPIVLVPDLGKGINFTDLNGTILFDRQLGLGLQVIDEHRQVRYPSLAWVVVRQRMRQQALAEELRVLYVALTRAKEHLILIGTCDGGAEAKWRQAWANHDGPFPAETVLAARTPLDWLGPTAAAVGDLHFRVTTHPAADVVAWSKEQAEPPALSPDQTARARLDPLVPPPPVPAEAAAVVERLGARYPFAAHAKVEAARSVTTLAKPASAGRRSALATEPVLNGPKFLAGDRPLQATDRGTATHAVLERLDFAAVSTADDVAASVSRLVAAKRLSEAEGAAVDVDAIVWLLSTEVGRRLRAGGLHREVPVYFARPDDGAPASDDCMDRVMARGRLDVLVPDGDGWRIVDYKTDRVSGEWLDRRAAEYGEQMKLYSQAIEQITGKTVRGATLVFLHPRELREV